MADRAVRGGSPPPRGNGSAWGGSPRGWSPEPAGCAAVICCTYAVPPAWGPWLYMGCGLRQGASLLRVSRIRRLAARLVAQAGRVHRCRHPTPGWAVSGSRLLLRPVALLLPGAMHWQRIWSAGVMVPPGTTSAFTKPVSRRHGYVRSACLQQVPNPANSDRVWARAGHRLGGSAASRQMSWSPARLRASSCPTCCGARRPS